MKEVRISVDKRFLKELRRQLGITTDVEVVQAAFTTLSWVVGEIEKRRVILSSTKEGWNVRRLYMPELENVRATA